MARERLSRPLQPLLQRGGGAPRRAQVRARPIRIRRDDGRRRRAAPVPLFSAAHGEHAALEAFELRDGAPGGYTFEVLGDPEGEPPWVFRRTPGGSAFPFAGC
ncbi:MAG: DUF7686 domain-containing protein [Steroidobacteraceae bacterium]